MNLLINCICCIPHPNYKGTLPFFRFLTELGSPHSYSSTSQTKLFEFLSAGRISVTIDKKN